MIDREQDLNRQYRGVWEISGKGPISFPGELGGKQVIVEVSRIELVGESGSSLARRLRFSLISAACNTQTVVATFSDPVRVNIGSLSMEKDTRDAKGRRVSQSIPVDPLLPFRGDKQAKKTRQALGVSFG